MALKFVIIDTKTGTEIASEFLIARGDGHSFKTGSVGYNANGKMTLPSVNDGEIMARHQISVNLVEIKTK